MANINTTIPLPEEIRDHAKVIAKKEGLTVSAVLRRALKVWSEKK